MIVVATWPWLMQKTGLSRPAPAGGQQPAGTTLTAPPVGATFSAAGDAGLPPRPIDPFTTAPTPTATVTPALPAQARPTYMAQAVTLTSAEMVVTLSTAGAHVESLVLLTAEQNHIKSPLELLQPARGTFP